MTETVFLVYNVPKDKVIIGNLKNFFKNSFFAIHILKTLICSYVLICAFFSNQVRTNASTATWEKKYKKNVYMIIG